jgi:SAM-dependent methyltransferase
LAKRSIVVDGITYSEEERAVAAQRCRKVWLHNLEEGLPTVNGSYDVVIISHTLEHIANPSQLMSDLKSVLSENGTVLCAIPNMLFLYNRIKLLFGKVEYEQYGLMDYTHVRWYTWKSIVELFEQYGFETDVAKANGNVPLGPIRKLMTKNMASRFDSRVVQMFPGLLAWEFLHRFTKSQ